MLTYIEQNGTVARLTKRGLMQIRENEVYTTHEMQQILKISQSTAMRMLKSGLIRGAKVGKQYRIMGKELLRLVSPKFEDKVGKIYNKGRRWVHEGIGETERDQR